MDRLGENLERNAQKKAMSDVKDHCTDKQTKDMSVLNLIRCAKGPLDFHALSQE
jgi:hypothetical protein